MSKTTNSENKIFNYLKPHANLIVFLIQIIILSLILFLIPGYPTVIGYIATIVYLGYTNYLNKVKNEELDAFKVSIANNTHEVNMTKAKLETLISQMNLNKPNGRF